MTPNEIFGQPGGPAGDDPFDLDLRLVHGGPSTADVGTNTTGPSPTQTATCGSTCTCGTYICQYSCYTCNTCNATGRPCLC